ncbi:hypothetical protein AAFF_G00182540 [Aldrovandia affinis]|uniref:Uncharacterized protein n=1 Tax=Aldrovandia affinis TaxID=143900 RepID=A0AAD7R0A1_9TELE|nr:hypothetical protein AAFF_G00182540 [Aldrovandia affinis]
MPQQEVALLKRTLRTRARHGPSYRRCGRTHAGCGGAREQLSSSNGLRPVREGEAGSGAGGVRAERGGAATLGQRRQEAELRRKKGRGSWPSCSGRHGDSEAERRAGGAGLKTTAELDAVSGLLNDAESKTPNWQRAGQPERSCRRARQRRGDGTAGAWRRRAVKRSAGETGVLLNAQLLDSRKKAEELSRIQEQLEESRRRLQRDADAAAPRYEASAYDKLTRAGRLQQDRTTCCSTSTARGSSSPT